MSRPFVNRLATFFLLTREDFIIRLFLSVMILNLLHISYSLFYHRVYIVSIPTFFLKYGNFFRLNILMFLVCFFVRDLWSWVSMCVTTQKINAVVMEPWLPRSIKIYRDTILV